jgi:hypothetical protein
MMRYILRERTAFLLWGIFLFGCGEKDPLIREKLDMICASDLRAIIPSFHIRRIPKANIP